MSFLSKLMNMSGDQKDEDDDYFLDDDYDDGDDYEDEDKGQKGSIFAKRSSDGQGAKSGFLGRKVVSIDEARDMEVTMIKPQGMDDSREICDYLLAGKAVVLNMEGMNMDVAQRIIDLPSEPSIPLTETSSRSLSIYLWHHPETWSFPVIFPEISRTCFLKRL